MDDKPAAPSARSARYRYLPLLSLMLVLFVGAWFTFQLWPNAHKERVAAYGAALKRIERDYYEKVDEATLHKAAMGALVQGLGDSHSSYLDRRQANDIQERTKGEFGGVGALLGVHEDGAMVVEVFDGPAKEAGLKAHDVIVAVDGQGVGGMELVHITGRIRGEVGTTVSLSLHRAGTGEAQTLEIVRDEIKIDTVRHEVLEPGVGLIWIGQFDEHTVQDVRDALKALQEGGTLKGLIIDVRGNGGGLLGAAVDVVDLLVDDGVIVKLDSRLSRERIEFVATPMLALPAPVPIVVLVDGFTASASEVMAGALQSLGRAALVGARTFGKGAVGRNFALPDGGALMLTVAHYTVASGKVIEGKGIEPDVKVGELPPAEAMKAMPPEEQMAIFRKAQLEQSEKAIEVLKARMAAEEPAPPAAEGGDQ